MSFTIYDLQKSKLSMWRNHPITGNHKLQAVTQRTSIYKLQNISLWRTQCKERRQHSCYDSPHWYTWHINYSQITSHHWLQNSSFLRTALQTTALKMGWLSLPTRTALSALPSKLSSWLSSLHSIRNVLFWASTAQALWPVAPVPIGSQQQNSRNSRHTDFCDTYTECWVFHVLSTPCGLTYILAQC